MKSSVSTGWKECFSRKCLIPARNSASPGDVSQQPDQRRALRVGVGVEVVVRPPPLVRNHRPEHRLRLAQVGLPLPAHVLAGLVGAQFVGVPEVLRVGPEALGQPGLAPVAVGGEVAPPVVRHLVGDEAVAREVLLGALVVDRALAEHRGGGALGAAADSRDGDLVVLVPRIGNAELLVEEGHHRRGLVEAAVGVLDVLRIHPVVHRDVAVEVLDDLVGAGDQHREIGRMGQVEPPVVRPGAGPGSLADADQHPRSRAPSSPPARWRATRRWTGPPGGPPRGTSAARPRGRRGC